MIGDWPFLPCTGPQEETIGQITAFQKLFLAPGFLAYIGVLFAISFSIIFYFGPRCVFSFVILQQVHTLVRYGKKSMLWYIAVCSLIGGISVSVTTGLGSAIVTTAMGDNQVNPPVFSTCQYCSPLCTQFKHGFIYFLLVFVATTLSECALSEVSTRILTLS